MSAVNLMGAPSSSKPVLQCPLFCTAFSIPLTLVIAFQGNLYKSLTGLPFFFFFHLRCLLCMDYFEWRHSCEVCEIIEYCFGCTVVVGQWSLVGLMN